jgi:hypothetical protein
MKVLSRQKFVDICNQAIQKTRANITINNQLDGYIQYHREIKENDYLMRNVRRPIRFFNGENQLMFNHDLIEHTGMGNCHELARYLLVEIARAIKAEDAQASLRIVSSQSYDHVYLSIKIKLENELTHSEWEVDAWDPRIIDISPRPDGSIKNKESLDYGYTVEFLNSVHTKDVVENQYPPQYKQLISLIKKPIEGPPLGNATPVRKMLEMNDDLYSNFTLDDAYESKRIPKTGALEYLQQVSFWQKERTNRRNSKYKEKNETHRSKYNPYH